MMMERNGKALIEVLVVDDHDAVRSLLQEVLETHGGIAEVFAAADVPSARRVMAVRGERIGLILLDHFMPGVRGLEFARELAQGEGAPVAVIMVTGSLLGGMESAFLGLASERLLPIAVVHKPIVLKRLFPLVENALERMRQARRAQGDEEPREMHRRGSGGRSGRNG
jgi:CheY-like chemotaxis protein